MQGGPNPFQMMMQMMKGMGKGGCGMGNGDGMKGGCGGCGGGCCGGKGDGMKGCCGGKGDGMMGCGGKGDGMKGCFGGKGDGMMGGCGGKGDGMKGCFGGKGDGAMMPGCIGKGDGMMGGCGGKGDGMMGGCGGKGDGGMMPGCIGKGDGMMGGCGGKGGGMMGGPPGDGSGLMPPGGQTAKMPGALTPPGGMMSPPGGCGTGPAPNMGMLIAQANAKAGNPLMKADGPPGMNPAFGNFGKAAGGPPGLLPPALSPPGPQGIDKVLEMQKNVLEILAKAKAGAPGSSGDSEFQGKKGDDNQVTAWSTDNKDGGWKKDWKSGGDDWKKDDWKKDNWNKKDDWKKDWMDKQRNAAGDVERVTKNQEMTVAVKGLPWDLEEATLRNDFQQCGEIFRFCHLKSKGNAFIMYKEEEHLQKALEYGGKEYHGRWITVGKVSDGGGGGGRGRGHREPRVERNEEMTVVVRGLDSSNIDEDVFRSDFAAYGEIERLGMPKDHNGEFKGIAFIQYKTEEAIEKALALNETEYKGRNIVVRKATDPTRGGGEKGKGKGAERNDELTVVLRGFDYSIEVRKLRSDFESCGEIERINVPKDDQGWAKGIAFIQYKTEEGMTKALEWNDTWYKGKQVTVQKVGEEKQDRKKDRRQQREKAPDGPTIYVAALSFDVTDDDLKWYFGKVGEVVWAQVMRGGKGKGKGKKDRNASRGSALVVFKTEEEVQKAIDECHEQDWKGRTMIVRKYEKAAEVQLDFSALSGEGDMSFLDGETEDEDVYDSDADSFDSRSDVESERSYDGKDEFDPEKGKGKGKGKEGSGDAPADGSAPPAAEGAAAQPPDASMDGSAPPAQATGADAASVGAPPAMAPPDGAPPAMAPPAMAPPDGAPPAAPAATGDAPAEEKRPRSRSKRRRSGSRKRRSRSGSRRRSRSRRRRSPSVRRPKVAPKHEEAGEFTFGQAVAMFDPDGKEMTPETAGTKFSDFGFHPKLLGEIESSGFQNPSEIQSYSWQISLKGNDVVGIASTGSGKTIAFLFPVFDFILRGDVKKGDPMMVCLAPTRELAVQTEKEANKFGVNAGIHTVCVYGGQPKGEQARAIQAGIHCLIATPGRLNDFLEGGKDVSLKNVSKVVVDEADRMLDAGFEPQIRKILREVPEERHTQFFTATWTPTVQKLAADFLKRPYQVRIGNTDQLQANKSITQIVKIVDPDKKVKELTKLFLQFNISEKGTGENRALIFCNQKKMCEQLEDGLNRAKVNCQSIHGDKTQAEREKALEDLRVGNTKILCATDVAARGLDVKGVTLVVNYDPPKNSEDYVHRIGRTGRAGKKGTSVTFLTDRDDFLGRQIKTVMLRSEQEIPQDLQKLIDGTLPRKKRAPPPDDRGGRGGRSRSRGRRSRSRGRRSRSRGGRGGGRSRSRGRKSRSPPRRRSRSGGRKRSPSRKRRSPSRRRSPRRSPPRRGSPSPQRRGSPKRGSPRRSPPRRGSPSPQRRGSPKRSPPRRGSRSPPRRGSPSPKRRSPPRRSPPRRSRSRGGGGNRSRSRDAPRQGGNDGGGSKPPEDKPWTPPVGPPPGDGAPWQPPAGPPAQAPPPAFGAPPPNFGAPPPGYGAPPPGYGAPPPNFGAPPPNFGPPPGYGAPPPNFGAPPPSFGAPPPGAPW